MSGAVSLLFFKKGRAAAAASRATSEAVIPRPSFLHLLINLFTAYALRSHVVLHHAPCWDE